VAEQSIGKLNLQMTMSAGQFHAEMDKVQAKLHKLDQAQARASKGAGWAEMTGGVTALATSFSALTNAAGAVGAVWDRVSAGLGVIRDVAAALYAAGDSAVRTYAEFEKLGISFKVMTGSAAAGKEMLDSIIAAGAATPFESMDLIKGVQRLMNYGLSPGKSFNTLMDLGDMLAASPDGMATAMERATLAIGQMVSKGAVATQEMNQLAEVGIPFRKAMDEYLKARGLLSRPLEVMVEAREVTGQQGVEALVEYSKKYYKGLMAEQSQSMLGLWSTAKDNVTLVLRDLGEEIVRAFDLRKTMQMAIGLIGDTKEAVKSLTPALDAAGGAFRAVRDVAGDAFRAALDAADKYHKALGGGEGASKAWYNMTLDFLGETGAQFVSWGNLVLGVVGRVVSALGMLVTAGEKATAGLRGTFDYLRPDGQNRTIQSDLWDIGSAWFGGGMPIRGKALLSDQLQAGGVGAEIAALGDGLAGLSLGDPDAVRRAVAARKAKGSDRTADDMAEAAVASFGRAFRLSKSAANPVLLKNDLPTAAYAARTALDAVAGGLRDLFTAAVQTGGGMDAISKRFDVDVAGEWFERMEKAATKYAGMAPKDPLREFDKAMREITELEGSNVLSKADADAARAAQLAGLNKFAADASTYRPPTAALAGSREAVSAELRWRDSQTGRKDPIERIRAIMEEQKRMQQEQVRLARQLANQLKPVPVVAIN
jgi:tape measure domain-containing protein